VRDASDCSRDDKLVKLSTNIILHLLYSLMETEQLQEVVEQVELIV